MFDMRRFLLSILVLVASFFLGTGIWAVIYASYEGIPTAPVFITTPYPLSIIVGVVFWLLYELSCPVSILRMRLYTITCIKKYMKRVADPRT